MILVLRDNAFVRLLWVVMGLYVLNISADTADHDPPHIAEDLTFNDQESMVEILVETVLGYEDTFEEFDDPDGEDQSKKSTQKIDLVFHNSSDLQRLYESIIGNESNFSNPRIILSLGFYQLDSPPPNS
mgnify:CR=1 FL=1